MASIRTEQSAESHLIQFPSPRPGENLFSYVAHLTRENNYPSPYWINWYLMNRNEPTYSEDYIGALAQLTGQDPKRLLQLTPHRFADKLNVIDKNRSTLDELATKAFVYHGPGNMRVCPRCFAMGRPWNILWLMRPVTTCLEHRLLLIDRCSSCQKPIRQSSLWEGSCTCGVRLADMDTATLPPNSEDLQAQRVFQEGLLSEPGRDDSQFRMIDFLHSFIGRFPPETLAFADVRFPPKKADTMWWPTKVEHAVFAYAYRIVKSGRNEFFDLCTQWLARRSIGRRRVGLLADFGPILGILSRCPRETDFPYHLWFEEFLATRWYGGYPARNHESSSSTRMSALKAAKLLELNDTGVFLLLKNQYLDGATLPYDKKGATRAVLDAASVLRYLEHRRGAISLDEAARVSGIGSRLLSHLYYSKLLRAEVGPLSDGSKDVFVHPRNIQSLIGALQSASSPREAQMIDLTTMAEAEAIAIFAEVVRGDRRACVQTEAGRVTGIFVCPDVVLRSATGGTEKPDTLGVHEAAVRLGVLPHLLDSIVTAGLLTKCGTSVSGIRQFEQDYCWGGDAAIQLRVRPFRLRDWVRNGRLSPVLSLGHLQLFRRDEVAKFDPEHVCTLNEAAEILGLGRDSLRRLIDRGVLAAISGPTVDGCRDFLLSRASLTRQLTLKQAARFLGVRKEVLLEWVELGKIQPIAGPKIDGSRQYIISDETLEKLRLERPGKRSWYDTIPPAEGSNLVTIREEVSTKEAMQLLDVSEQVFYSQYRATQRLRPCRTQGRRRFFRYADVLEAMSTPAAIRIVQPQWQLTSEGAEPQDKDREMVTTAEAQVVLGVSETLFYRHYRKPRLLNPAHWDGQKAFFWRDEVELILAEAKRTRNRLELGELVQGMEAAKILGIRFQHFFRSLHENLSPITVVGQRGLYYDRHEVEALRDLRATTVTSGEVQRRFGISNHALQHWVRKGILKPVSGPNVDGKPKYRFSREEVEACSYQPRGPKNRQ